MYQARFAERDIMRSITAKFTTSMSIYKMRSLDGSLCLRLTRVRTQSKFPLLLLVDGVRLAGHLDATGSRDFPAPRSAISALFPQHHPKLHVVVYWVQKPPENKVENLTFQLSSFFSGLSIWVVVAQPCPVLYHRNSICLALLTCCVKIGGCASKCASANV